MNTIFKPYCSQISCVKFISHSHDSNQLFIVGTQFEPNNTLTLMRHAVDSCDEPDTLSRVLHKSDVMDIQYNSNHQRILTSGSDGSLNFYKISEDNLRMELDVGWDGVCPSPISGCIFNDERVVAVSEKGEIVVLRLDANVSHTARGFEFHFQDCSGIRAVESLDENSFVTVNGLGQVKCWDLRESTKKPCWSNQRAGEMVSIHCLARHPGQPNIIASGSTSNVYIWDTRATDLGTPIQLHTGVDDNDIWKIRFHPTSPNHLFLAGSCSGLVDISGPGSSFNWSDNNGDFGTLQMHRIIGGADHVTMTSVDVSDSLIVAATLNEMLCLVPLSGAV